MARFSQLLAVTADRPFQQTAMVLNETMVYFSAVADIIRNLPEDAPISPMVWTHYCIIKWGVIGCECVGIGGEKPCWESQHFAAVELHSPQIKQ